MVLESVLPAFRFTHGLVILAPSLQMHVGENYFETVQELSKVQVVKNMKKLPKENKRWDPIDDAMDITAVNAFNLVTKNIIGEWTHCSKTSKMSWVSSSGAPIRIRM